MKSYQGRIPAYLFLSVVGFVWPGLGCLAPPKQPVASALSQPQAPVEPADMAEPPVPPRQETLAAVEEFLSRTQDYRLGDKPARPANVQQAARPPEVRIAASPDVAKPELPVDPRGEDAALANGEISISSHAPAVPAAQPIPAVEAIRIRQPERAETPTSKSTGITNNPQEIQTPVSLSDSLILHLQNEVRTGGPASEWKLRLVLLALGRENELATLMDQSAPDASGMLAEMEAIALAVRNALKNPESAGELLKNLDSLRSKAAAQADPEVTRVALCRKVSTFGSFEELNTEDLVSGRTLQLIVYAEIENLQAVQDDSGFFHTRLATRTEVLKADGTSMWQREEPQVEDRCRRVRRDFFVAQRVTLPATLPAGNYVLQFGMEDKISGRIAENTTNFELLSPVSVAKKP